MSEKRIKGMAVLELQLDLWVDPACPECEGAGVVTAWQFLCDCVSRRVVLELRNNEAARKAPKP